MRIVNLISSLLEGCATNMMPSFTIDSVSKDQTKDSSFEET